MCQTSWAVGRRYRPCRQRNKGQWCVPLSFTAPYGQARAPNSTARVAHNKTGRRAPCSPGRQAALGASQRQGAGLPPQTPPLPRADYSTHADSSDPPACAPPQVVKWFTKSYKAGWNYTAACMPSCQALTGTPRLGSLWHTLDGCAAETDHRVCQGPHRQHVPYVQAREVADRVTSCRSVDVLLPGTNGND
jgi:hypothetical protein